MITKVSLMKSKVKFLCYECDKRMPEESWKIIIIDEMEEYKEEDSFCPKCTEKILRIAGQGYEMVKNILKGDRDYGVDDG